MPEIDDATMQALEAAAFRRLRDHLQKRTDVQNIDLMNMAGFCRNCLSRWMHEAATEQGVALDILLDPLAGVGAVYINQDKALSFRLYELADYDVGIYSQNATVTVSGLQRYKQ